MAFLSSTSARRTSQKHRPTRTVAVLRIALGFLMWMLLWGMLSQGQGWEFGIPVAAMATLAGHRLGLQSGALQPQALPAFLWFFLRELFSGGVDVTRRALHVNLPIAPAWQIFTLTSRDPRVCMMLSALIGLLPGTLASHHHERVLFVHTLDEHRDWKTAVIQLETLLARLLGDPRP